MAEEAKEAGKPTEKPVAKAAEEPSVLVKEFWNSLGNLAEQAKVALLKPAQDMIQTYGEKGVDFVDSLAGAIQEGNKKPKRKKK